MTANAYRPAPRTLLVVGIVGTTMFMDGLDSTILLTSLPAIAREMGLAPVALSITLTVYLLGQAVGAPVSGWLADRVGVLRAFCGAIVAFTVSSVLCGLAQDLPSLVAGRLLQGLAGAVMVPVGRLIVLRAAPKDQLVRAMNWMAVPWLLAPVVGPALGGFITDYLHWRWNFFINVPIGVLGLILSLRYLPDHRSATRRPLDLPGLVLTSAALSGVILGMEIAATGGGRWWVGALIAAAGVALGVAALRRSRRVAHPLIELDAVAIPTFRVGAITAGVLVRVSLHIPIFVLPLMLQVGFGMGAFAAGLVVVAGAAGDLLIKSVTTATVRALGFRTLLLASVVGFALFAGLQALFTPSTAFWVMAAVVFGFGVARSLHLTGLTAMQFADVPEAMLTGASTLQWVTQQMSRAVGFAVAALLVNLLALSHGGGPGVGDFRLAFVLAAGAILSAGAIYWRLPLDAGASASGKRANPPQT